MSKRTLRRTRRGPRQVAMALPLDLSSAVHVKGRTFRKQILPIGSITYKGRKITFDRAFLTELKESYDKQAYDQVPLVLANDANAHNMDPERFRGEVTGLEVTNKGLEAIIRTTREGARLIKANPRLGVSARILHNIEKADGRVFGKALNHVLATMDPKVTKMSPWQTVDLSTDNTEVVDLTAAHFTQEGSAMAKKSQAKGKGTRRATKPDVLTLTLTRDGETHEVNLSDLTDEEFQEILDLATEVREDEDEDVVDVTDDLDDDEDDEDEDSDEEDEDESDEDDDEDEEDEDEEDLSNLASLDNLRKAKKKPAPKGTKDGVDADKTKKVSGKAGLPEAFRKNAKKKSGKKDALINLSERIAQGEWRRERRRLLRAGVPPHMLDLAEPILSRPDDMVLDLSESGNDDVNASEVIRGLLSAAEGYLDIKPEIGHQVDLSNEDGDEDPVKDLNAAWDAEFGTV